jgi:hypothetical protein
MRKDENGNECPATLGEYRDMCAALAPNSKAVEWLDGKIAEQGRDEEVVAADSQVRMILMPMLIQ